MKPRATVPAAAAATAVASTDMLLRRYLCHCLLAVTSHHHQDQDQDPRPGPRNVKPTPLTSSRSEAKRSEAKPRSQNQRRGTAEVGGLALVLGKIRLAHRPIMTSGLWFFDMRVGDGIRGRVPDANEPRGKGLLAGCQCLSVRVDEQKMAVRCPGLGLIRPSWTPRWKGNVPRRLCPSYQRSDQ